MTPRDRFIEAVQEAILQCECAFGEPTGECDSPLHFALRQMVEAFADATCGGHYGLGDAGLDRKAEHRELCLSSLLRACFGGNDDERG